MFRANIYVLLLSYFQSPPRKNFINGILFSFLNSSGKNSHCKTLFLVRKRKISFFVALFRLANIQRKRYYLGKQVGRRVIRPLSYACSVQIALGSAPNGSAQVPPPPERTILLLSEPSLSLCTIFPIKFPAPEFPADSISAAAPYQFRTVPFKAASNWSNRPRPPPRYRSLRVENPEAACNLRPPLLIPWRFHRTVERHRNIYIAGYKLESSNKAKCLSVQYFSLKPLRANSHLITFFNR